MSELFPHLLYLQYSCTSKKGTQNLLLFIPEASIPSLMFPPVALFLALLCVLFLLL